MPGARPPHRSDRWCRGRRPVPPRCPVRHPMATIGRVTSRQLTRVSRNEKRAAIIRNGLGVCNKAGPQGQGGHRRDGLAPVSSGSSPGVPLKSRQPPTTRPPAQTPLPPPRGPPSPTGPSDATYLLQDRVERPILLSKMPRPAVLHFARAFCAAAFPTKANSDPTGTVLDVSKRCTGTGSRYDSVVRYPAGKPLLNRRSEPRRETVLQWVRCYPPKWTARRPRSRR